MPPLFLTAATPISFVCGRYRSLGDMDRDRQTDHNIRSLIESVLEADGRAGVETMIGDLIDPQV
ncbi:MAG: hypothetical protein R6W95_10015 [Desulfosarcina sp.]